MPVLIRAPNLVARRAREAGAVAERGQRDGVCGDGGGGRQQAGARKQQQHVHRQHDTHCGVGGRADAPRDYPPKYSQHWDPIKFIFEPN